jgi:hypothetical protein
MLIKDRLLLYASYISPASLNRVVLFHSSNSHFTMTMTTALPTAELRPYALNWADSFVALAFVVFVTGALYSARKIIAQDSPEYKAATAAALAAGSISGAPLSHTAVKPHTFSATKRVGTPAPPFAPNAVSGTPVSLDSTPKGARTPVEPIVPSLDDYRTVRRRKLRPLKPVYHMTMGEEAV